MAIELDTDSSVTEIFTPRENFCYSCGEEDGDHKDECPSLAPMAIELAKTPTEIFLTKTLRSITQPVEA